MNHDIHRQRNSSQQLGKEHVHFLPVSRAPDFTTQHTGFSLSHGTSFFAQLPSRRAPRSGTSASLTQPVATGSTSMA